MYWCGRYSRKDSGALKEKGYNVDVDKTITLGYVHDIGKYNGEIHGHVMRGYNLFPEIKDNL